MDTLADIHGRSHSFLFIHPREVFLAWCWVIARPLSSFGIALLSFPPGVGLTGVGLVHLSHTWQTPMCKGTPASDAMRRSQLQCRMCEFLFICSGLSLHMRGGLSWSDILLFEACPPICPWSSSSLEKYLPWLGWDHQVSNLWHLFPSHSTTSVSEPLL